MALRRFAVDWCVNTHFLTCLRLVVAWFDLWQLRQGDQHDMSSPSLRGDHRLDRIARGSTRGNRTAENLHLRRAPQRVCLAKRPKAGPDHGGLRDLWSTRA